MESIDPYQSTQFRGIGRLNVERSGLGAYHKLIEIEDFIAMPELITQMREDPSHLRYDMIFIDGMHLFDYTLLDFFFADRMLEVNGLILVDDIRHPPVTKFFEYARQMLCLLLLLALAACSCYVFVLLLFALLFLY